jgi:integrase
MGLTKFSIYKYVKTNKGWRYCKPAYSANNKIKPNVVLVDGKEEKHTEGGYYLNVDGQWEKVGVTAVQAQEGQMKRLARQRYERDTGERLPEPECRKELLSDAIARYLEELELKVAGKSRQPKTLAAAKVALREFAEQGEVRHLKEVSASHVARHMAWVIQESPTRSARTAANRFLQILQFLKHAGAVPMVGRGKSAWPLGMKDGPRYTENEVQTYADAELAKFFFVCSARENAIFQTFARAGLREQEISTLRRRDCVLDGPAPFLRVVERPEHNFTPKAYQIRDVAIDVKLVEILKSWLLTHERTLAFPTPRGKVDGHILRLCQRVAKQAGMDPDQWWLHKFRATYATRCLRAGMDLETLRAQLGHRDIESLARYVRALKGEERARKVEDVFAAMPLGADANSRARPM